MQSLLKALRQILSISGTYIHALPLLAILSSRAPSIDSICRRALIHFSVTVLFCAPAFASQLIIEPEMGRTPIIKEIAKANQSIQLVMYNLTDKTLLSALLEQQKKGRKVQVILEKTPYRTTGINKKTISQLKRANVAWLGNIPKMRFIHQKTLLIDNHKAMVMTFNFTHSAFKKQRNFALLIDDPAEVNEIAQHFNADWRGTSVPSQHSNLIWSPDDSRRKITALINNAKTELHIYAQSITDKGIMTALKNAATRGVKVVIITNKDWIASSQKTLLAMTESKPLSHAGSQPQKTLPAMTEPKPLSHADSQLKKAPTATTVPRSNNTANPIIIIPSKRYYIHAKVFIIDNQTAIIGSLNLTKNSLEQNRELSAITHDPTIIQQLQRTFRNDSFY